MERCKTCKYWALLAYGEPSAVDAGVCSKVVSYPEATGWPEENQPKRIKPEYQDRLAFIHHYRSDGIDLPPEPLLVTLENFGCVQHSSLANREANP